MLDIDITTLNDKQLEALKIISPELYRREMLRRNIYNSVADGIQDLAKKVYSLECNQPQKKPKYYVEYVLPVIEAASKLVTTYEEMNER